MAYVMEAVVGNGGGGDQLGLVISSWGPGWLDPAGGGNFYGLPKTACCRNGCPRRTEGSPSFALADQRFDPGIHPVVFAESTYQALYSMAGVACCLPVLGPVSASWPDL